MGVGACDWYEGTCGAGAGTGTACGGGGRYTGGETGLVYCVSSSESPPPKLLMGPVYVAGWLGAKLGADFLIIKIN